MLDEPYRWLEAVNNRRDYIEDQLRGGSPVVGLKYDDGLLLVTIGRGQRKIFEVHDRIALSAIGHSADVERLRMMATDTASVQGFQSSVDDVTLHRLTHFVLGPTIKQSFEAIFGSAYIIKMLLAELGVRGEGGQFIALNYDGTVQSNQDREVIGGTHEAETAMQNYLSAADASESSLTAALQLALETWVVGWELGLQQTDAVSDETTNEGSELTRDKERLHEVLRDELQAGKIEGVVLETSRRSNSKFRFLTSDEIDAAIADWL
jgi:proteasome alpha subunit